MFTLSLSFYQYQSCSLSIVFDVSFRINISLCKYKNTCTEDVCLQKTNINILIFSDAASSSSSEEIENQDSDNNSDCPPVRGRGIRH